MKTELDTNPSSVVDYIRAELRRGYFLQNDEQRYKERREKFYIFLSVPVKLEAFIFFGLLQCIDAFLMIFTVLPFRFLFAIILLVSRSLRNLWRIFTKSNLSCVAVLNPAEICDLLKGIIILSCSLVMMSIDSSYIYHQIKSQSVIKLYIFYNMLEVADKMLSSFGQDVLETLYWTATEPRKRPHFVVFHLMFAIVYVCMHSFLTLLQASTLNVAINSKNQALLTVMMSNNFVELKSMVFKKFEKTNLFHMSCSDVRERFHYIILITVVIIQTMEEYNWSEEHFFDLISVCVTVFITEIIVDWFKHSFVTRFNEVPTNVYEDYTLSLAYDLVGSKLKTAFSDHTDIISRRMGFIPLPLSVLIIRIFAGSFNFTNFFTILCMSLLFVLLIIFKLTLNVGLLGYSLEIIEERREIEEKANKKSASLPVSRHNSVSDLTQLVQEQPNDLNSQQQQVPPPKPIPVVRSNSMGTRSTPHSPSSSLGGSLENITEHLQNSFDTSMILSDSTVSLTSMNDGQNIALPPGSLSERKSSEHATFNRKLKKKLKQKFPFSALSFRRRISLQNEFQHLPSPTLASSAAGDQRHGEIRQSAKWFGGGGGGSDVRENDEEEQDENRPPSSSYDTTTTATATIDVPGGVHKKDPTLS